MGRACGKSFHISDAEEAFTWWIFFFMIMMPALGFRWLKEHFSSGYGQFGLMKTQCVPCVHKYSAYIRRNRQLKTYHIGEESIISNVLK